MMNVNDIIQIIVFCALIFFLWAIWRAIRFAASVTQPDCYSPDPVM